MAQVAVYEWVGPDGTGLGCGTRVEFDYWQSQGVIADDDKLGELLTHEPADQDAKRIAAWGIAA